MYEKKVIKNTFWLFIAQAITKALSFLLFVYLGRTLKTGGFGVFNTALAFSSIFVVFVDYGFNLYLMREIAKDKKKTGALMGSILPLKILLGFLALAGLYLTVKFMNYGDALTEAVTLLLGVYYVLFSFSTFFRVVFMAHEMMEYESIFGMIDKVLVVGAVVLVVTQKTGILGIAVAYVAVEAAILAASVYLVELKFPGLKYVFSRPVLKKAVSESSYFFLANALLMTYLFLDSILLSKMKDQHAVGLYNASYNLVYNLRILVAPVVMALFPSLALNAANNMGKFRKMFLATERVLFLAGLAIALLCFLLRYQIMALFGRDYSAAVGAFAIMLIAVPFIYANGFYGYVLTSLNKQRTIFYFLIATCVLNIALNLLLIPGLGYIGATIAKVTAEILFFALCFTKLLNAGVRR